MRPLRLDLHGFTVFREPVVVDFTDTDFFALVGPTGSGKSTVLDAICFALYGTVPRWGDRRAIANALAPSAATARVRLVFEVAGARYVATRVVRRDGKGRVATSHAGLELLPPGFDLSQLDGELTELGQPLAGTPGELDAAVLDVVGLPYDQFTACVVLPQGAFAEFLHAKPAARQQILVNLLGLSVYEKVRDQATDRGRTAEAALAASDRLLAELADATPEALAAAQQREDILRDLAARLDTLVPALVAARARAVSAHQELAALDADLDRLGRVSVPADGTGVAEALRQAAAAQARTAAEVAAAEEDEEKLRAAAGAAGDPAALHRLLDAYDERDRLAGQVAQLSEALAPAQRAHAEAVRAHERAAGTAQQAQAAVATAAAELEQARTADRAASLRPHLRAGQPCPVCEQPVASVPAVPASRAMTAANAALERAQQAATRAGTALSAADGTVRERDRTLVAARTRRDQAATRLSELDSQLAGAAGAGAVRDALAEVESLTAQVTRAGVRVRAAREAARAATAAARTATDREKAAWQRFDAVRDALATLGPPAADRGDLAGAWTALAGWAATATGQLRVRRAELARAAAAADDSAGTARDAIVALFTRAGLAVPPEPPGTGEAGTGEGYTRAAAVAAERARAGSARLAERREQAQALRAQRAGHERDAQVAKALAGHLRANNFERWLLEEALDTLVDGASRILRDLSGGQYELVHERGEFAVLDHHDAGLRRAVRTLSGGETFQASLALALALSEQLAGMSTGTASLESIVLDEGFGTLDTSTLDTVAATLENLAARGDRMVGVVTHVTALAERIPVRFEVRKDARTASITRTGL